MSKVMPCSEIFPGCGFIARAETDGDVLNCVGRHVREIHGMKEKAQATIRDDKCEQARRWDDLRD